MDNIKYNLELWWTDGPSSVNIQRKWPIKISENIEIWNGIRKYGEDCPLFPLKKVINKWGDFIQANNDSIASDFKNIMKGKVIALSLPSG